MNETIVIKRKIKKFGAGIMIILTATLFSCEEFFNPEQALIVVEEDFYKNWNEYRSAEMGLYALQQNLVDQIVILGDLRGDLLEVTQYADKDLNEIYNFNISPDNKYASPNNFYKLIEATNDLARQLEQEHPEVLDKSIALTNYDRLYGEVICMRAWAYFNAVKIYGEVPYIWPSLTSSEEITEYLNTSQQYYDIEDINFNINGYNNDSIRIDTIILDKIYLDMGMVIDTFTNQLSERIKAVGVIHNLENSDQTWDVTVWNMNAYRSLMGEMHLFNSNLTSAYEYFYPILYNYESETSSILYGLDDRFSNNNWKSIFEGIDVYEHILTLQFDKSFQQQNSLQKLFSTQSPNLYMMRPTEVAINNWETIWSGMKLTKHSTIPENTLMKEYGVQGDFYRGYGVSYVYMKGEEMMTEDDVRLMLYYKSIGNNRDVENLIEDAVPVVYKYTIGKDIFDHDADFIIYRASNIHLYCAEIYAYWLHDIQGVYNTNLNKGLDILNNGGYRNPVDNNQLGVRGRVGFGSGDDAVYLEDYIYQHDPYTNEIIGYLDYTANLAAKKAYLEDQIIQERARELAYEGHRFFDLVRVAKKRGDNSYLADKVAAKFSGEKAEQIRELLMNEENWYVPLARIN